MDQKALCFYDKRPLESTFRTHPPDIDISSFLGLLFEHTGKTGAALATQRSAPAVLLPTFLL
jgi:hypothetical protein